MYNLKFTISNKQKNFYQNSFLLNKNDETLRILQFFV